MCLVDKVEPLARQRLDQSEYAQRQENGDHPLEVPARQVRRSLAARLGKGTVPPSVPQGRRDPRQGHEKKRQVKQQAGPDDLVILDRLAREEDGRRTSEGELKEPLRRTPDVEDEVGNGRMHEGNVPPDKQGDEAKDHDRNVNTECQGNVNHNKFTCSKLC